MKNILDMKIEELESEFLNLGLKLFRAKQVLNWIYEKQIFDFSDMSNLSKDDRILLNSEFTIDIPKIIYNLKSSDGTFKYLLELADGNVVESVLMEYTYGYSICVSSQVGCKRACDFCASGKDGLVRNLTSGEIIGQILAVSKKTQKHIERVVAMGIGEPFDNYYNFIKFAEIANASWGLGMGMRKITVSTSGVVPKIYEFADYNSQINLAISLHQTDNQKRSNIMPVNRMWDIEELIDACKYYINKTNRRLSFEYALIPSNNDTIDDANRLAQLLKGMLCYVNIIPVNKIDGVTYKGDLKLNSSHFYEILRKNGIHVTVRRELGRDIEAACGQLRRSRADKVQRSNK